MRRRTGTTLAVVGLTAAALAASTPVVRAGEPAPDPVRTVVASLASGRLLFVGASYSIGVGATGPARTLPELVARRLDRELRVDAVSGTGFQNPGPRHQGTFRQRIGHDPVDPQPRIVVIQGGRDDVSFPVAGEYDAVVATIALARERFPQSQVVLLGPIPASLPVSPAVLAIRSAIARAATAAGAGFVDPIAQQWITPRNERAYRGRVPGHPNDAGYAYLASRLLTALPAALATAAPPERPSPVT